MLKCVTKPDPEVLAWCDRAADYFMRSSGLAPITARTAAWLMICDPPEQSAADLAEAVEASRASLTSTLRELVAAGLVRKSVRPGHRTAYYRIVDDAWASALRARFGFLASFVGLVREGQKLVGDDPVRGSRLVAADEVYSWLAEEIEPLWQRWEATRAPREDS